MSNKNTPKIGKTKKRALSSPVDLSDTKKTKQPINSSVTIPEETMHESGTDTVTQVTLGVEQLAQISSLLKVSIDEQLSEMVNTIVDGVVGGLKQQIDQLTWENNNLKLRVETLELKCDRAEQYSRRNCLRLSGVSESDDEIVDNSVLEIAAAIDANITIFEIDRSHRLGKPRLSSNSSKNKPRDIIIKLTSYRSRQILLKHKSKLKDKGYKGVFLSESLTTARDNVFFQARKLVKDKEVSSAWTSDGTIIVKDNNLKIHRLESQHDLDQLKSELGSA